ncbi:hypothetical protein LRR81_21155 [Metabacillus sp. GX 13764]|uniref:hypothetical protein n=1 Tax=Metabacillus kandeliae TaxID=2900151 RepID=UPI001E3DE1E2|nr:hypothetical protein [Metabacillus kandeliae]MCD7036745.1 hypothetical protein [Metabacillus kandeliae]
MDTYKRIRFTLERDSLETLQESLMAYIRYAEEQGFSHSTERAVLDYLNKKYKSAKEARVSMQLSIKDVGILHDSLSDHVLYSEGDQRHILPLLEQLETLLEQKTKQQMATFQGYVFCRSLANVETLLSKQAIG